MRILAIDPGNTHSALIHLQSDGMPCYWSYLDNGEALRQVEADPSGHLAIEMIASYGMAVGSEVFDTCIWIGRFIQAWNGPYTQVFRKDVKMHLCGQTKAKDANVRQALIDRFGPGKDKAIGTKKNPGPLYGISGDIWAALAVAVTHYDKTKDGTK